jgi:hypothetical protein
MDRTGADKRRRLSVWSARFSGGSVIYNLIPMAARLRTAASNAQQGASICAKETSILTRDQDQDRAPDLPSRRCECAT